MATGDDPARMDHLIIRSLQGRAAPAEEAELTAWRRDGQENQRRYATLARLWSMTGAARPALEVGPAPDPGLLIGKAEAWLAEEPSRKGAGGRRTTRRQPGMLTTLNVAALAAAFIPVGFGLAHLLGPADPGPGPLAESEITTGAGEMTTVELSDGTSIRLGPRSRLRLSRDASGRVADLDGRAFFGVQSSPGERFAVRTRHGSVFVLGTRLEVRSEQESFRVLVVDGSVRVAVGEASAELMAGEMSQSVNGGPPAVFTVDDVYAQLDWMGNAMVFQATPLRRVIFEIELRYDVEVVLESPGLAEFTVTAAFTGQTVGHVVAVICEIIGAECLIENRQVRIREQSPPRSGSR
jgi:ferric-dicitrate binding protein FerR (iron transport regulator)